MRQRDNLLRKARKSQREVDWSNYKRKRNFVNNQLKIAPDKFWKCIKQLFPAKILNTSVSASIEIDGSMTNDKQLIANGFCRHFSTIANSLKGKFFKFKDVIWGRPTADKYNTSTKFHFQHVSVPIVMKYLKNLKPKKAMGLDGIPSCLLKDGSKYIAKPLAHIINCPL